MNWLYPLNSITVENRAESPLDYVQQLSVLNASGDVILPKGDDFLRADFLRAGPDLVIETPSGSSYLIPAYFMSETPPALVNADGAVLNAALVTALVGPNAPGQVAQLGPNAAASPLAVGLGQPIGQVSEASGSVTVTHPDGTQGTLVTGGQIFQGDVLQTGAKASVSLVFADDTVFSLAEDARMVMDEMVYDPDTQTGAFSAQVVSGVFSFVSGQVAKTSTDGMVVMTPTTTIGIRGSTAMANAAAEGVESKITLVPDVDGNVGELSISTRAGIQVLNQPNASTTVISAFAPPSQVVFLSPQEVQKSFGATFTTLTKAVAKQAKVKAVEAQGRAENAQSEAKAAKAEADQAKEAASKAEGAASEAEAKAEAAQAEAEAAKAELEAAKAQGNEEAIAAAEAKLAAAEAKVDQALAQVEVAKAEVQKAVQVADKAGAEATKAVATAEKAQAQAEQAQQFSSLASTASQSQEQAFTAEKQAQGEAEQKTAPDSAKDGPDATAKNADSANTTETVTVTVEDTPPEVVVPEIILAPAPVIVIAPVTTTTTKTDDTTTTTTTTTTTIPDVNVSFPGTTGSYDFVANTNDILTATAANDALVLTLGGQAESGDSFSGNANSQTLNFAASANSLSHTLAIKDTEIVNLPNVGAGNTFTLNVRSAGSTQIALGAAGTYNINGTPTDGTTSLQQIWTITAPVDGTTKALSLTGSTGNDAVNIQGFTTNVIKSMIGIEFLYIEGGTLTFQSAVTGTTLTHGEGSGITLSSFDDSVTIGTATLGQSGSTFWGSIDGGSGNDTLTLNGNGTTATVNSMTSIENLIGIVSNMGAANATLGAGGQTLTASGTFTNFTGGSGTDVVTLGSGTNVLGNVSAVESINGTSGTDTVTYKDGASTTTTLTNVETVNGGTGNELLTFEGSGATTITGNGGNDTFSLNGTGVHTVRFNALSDGSDTISGFDLGSGGIDILSYNSTLLSNGGNSTTLQEITTTNGAVSINSLFVELGGANFNATDTGTVAGAQAVINALDTTSIASGDKVLFVMDNGTNSYMWHFTEDGTAGVQGTGDLVLVETLNGVADAAAFADGDFTTYSTNA